MLGAQFTAYQAPGQEVQIRAKSGVLSRYIGKAGLTLFDAPVAVNEVVLAKGPWYGGLCTSRTLASSKHGKFGNELDITVGYRKAIWTTNGIWAVTSDLSVSYFIMGDWELSNDDRPIADLRFEMTEMPYVQPYVAFRYFGSISDLTKDGYFFWLGIKREQPLGIHLPSGEVKLNADISLAFATEKSLGREGGFVFGRVQTSLQVPLSKRFSLSPYYMIQLPSGDQTGRKEDFTDGIHHVFGGFLSAKF